jgi:hypothetical protein
VSVADFGAVGDGVADDSHAIARAIDSLPHGGTVWLPPGRYRANVLVTKSNVTLLGAGRSAPATKGGMGGTILAPADPARPALQVGDGAAVVSTVTIAHLHLDGDGASPTSDGLVIVGAFWVNVTDVSIQSFGRDNVRLESRPDRPSFYETFSQFTSRWARGSCFRAVYGASYVTSTYLSDFSILGWGGAGATAIDLDGVSLALSNGWVEADGSRRGHVVLRNGAQLLASQVVVDSPSSDDILLEIDRPPGYVPEYVRGLISVDGSVRWANGQLVSLSAGGLRVLSGNQAHLLNSNVLGWLAFNQQDAQPPSETVASSPSAVPDVRVYRTGETGSGAETLRLDGAALRVPLTSRFPLAGSAGGFLWRDEKTGQPRWSRATTRPRSDGDGAALSTFVAAPAKASDPCTPGDWAADGRYVYVCTAPGAWRRAELSTW